MCQYPDRWWALWVRNECRPSSASLLLPFCDAKIDRTESNQEQNMIRSIEEVCVHLRCVHTLKPPVHFIQRSSSLWDSLLDPKTVRYTRSYVSADLRRNKITTTYASIPNEKMKYIRFVRHQHVYVRKVSFYIIVRFSGGTNELKNSIYVQCDLILFVSLLWAVHTSNTMISCNLSLICSMPLSSIISNGPSNKKISNRNHQHSKHNSVQKNP